MQILAGLLAGMILMYVLVIMARWWGKHAIRPKIHELQGAEIVALMQAAAERRIRGR